MKAAVMEATAEPIVVREFDDPEIGPADALIRVEACGVCRSDWHIWQGIQSTHCRGASSHRYQKPADQGVAGKAQDR